MEIIVDERAELWEYYGTAGDGVRIYVPVTIITDEFRNSKPEDQILVSRRIDGIGR